MRTERTKASVARKDLLRAISQLAKANSRLRDVLLHFEQSNIELADLVASGGSIREAIGIDLPQRRRRELTATLDAFEAARHQYRIALFACCLEEGGSVSEFGRAMGVSRQRAAFLARELSD